MMDIARQVADIQKRIRGLKANRPVSISQIDVLEVSQSFTVTATPTNGAVFEVTIDCAGAPIADVSFAGHANIGQGIIPQSVMWSLSGNQAIAQCGVVNNAATTDTRTITITAWALNGLSATIERTS